MAVDIDTATDHVDLFDRLVAFLTSTTGGPDWTLLRQDTDFSLLLQAPGLSSTDEINMGLSLHADAGADTYAIGMWMFRAYNDALPDLEQPGHSGVKYWPVWNTSMPYWFVANGQRFIGASKVSTVYPSVHMGKFLPYGMPSEYPQPYYLAAPVESPTVRWSTIVEDNRSFFDPGISAVLGQPNGQWRAVQNFGETSGGESPSGLKNYVWPYQSSINGQQSSTMRYRELRENLDGTYPLFPLVLLGMDPDLDIYGEIDGAFAVTGFNTATENIVQIDGEDYLMLQNMHRTARYYYAAVKLV